MYQFLCLFALLFLSYSYKLFVPTGHAFCPLILQEIQEGKKTPNIKVNLFTSVQRKQLARDSEALKAKGTYVRQEENKKKFFINGCEALYSFLFNAWTTTEFFSTVRPVK